MIEIIVLKGYFGEKNVNNVLKNNGRVELEREF